MLDSIKKIAYDRQEVIRDNIQDILSSKEFVNAGKPDSFFKGISDTIKDMLLNLWDSFKNILGKIIKPDNIPFLNGKPLSEGVSLVFAIIGILVMIFLFGILLFFVLRNIRRSRVLKQEDDALLLSALNDPSHMEEKAMEHYRKGDLKQAIRFLYIALLLKLNRLDIIKIDKSKTNKQYLKEIINSSTFLYESVSDFTNAFNLHWYGNRDLDDAKFQYWHGRYTLMAKGEKA